MADTPELDGMPKRNPNVTHKLIGTIAVRPEDPDDFPPLNDKMALADLMRPTGKRTSKIEARLIRITEQTDKDDQLEYVLTWRLV